MVNLLGTCCSRNSVRLDLMLANIDHDYLSTQVIQIPSKSKTSFSSSFMQNVLPRSGTRAYTVSDDASADQR